MSTLKERSKKEDSNSLKWQLKRAFIGKYKKKDFHYNNFKKILKVFQNVKLLKSLNHLQNMDLWISGITLMN